MRFMRFLFGLLLSVLLLGVAPSGAQTHALHDAPTSRTFLILGSNLDPQGGDITIYPLMAGIPQDLGAPYLYRISGFPEALSIDSATQRLYVAAAGWDQRTGAQVGRILGYSYSGANGFTLTELPGSPYNAASFTGGSGLAGDYVGGFLYASGDVTYDISGFRIDGNGRLGQQVPGSPYLDDQDPLVSTFDAQDGFLYSGNFLGTVSGYEVNATTGALTALPGSPYASGSFPAGIVADPVHHLLYATAYSDGTIWVYTIMPSGALVPASGSPVSTGEQPFNLVINPSGTFLYTTAYPSNNVLGYHINTTTGALSALSGSPFPVGREPGALALDPTGTFLYVGNYGDDSLSGFRIGPSGGLTPLPGSPFALPVIDPETMVTVTLQ